LENVFTDDWGPAKIRPDLEVNFYSSFLKKIFLKLTCLHFSRQFYNTEMISWHVVGMQNRRIFFLLKTD